MKKFLLPIFLFLAACTTTGTTAESPARKFKVGNCLVYNAAFKARLQPQQRQAIEEVKQSINGVTSKYYVIEFVYKGRLVQTDVVPFDLVEANADLADCDAAAQQTTSDFSQNK